MKITKKQLKKIIQEELSVLLETKEDHILGVYDKRTKKNATLEKITNEMEPMDPDSREEWKHHADLLRQRTAIGLSILDLNDELNNLAGDDWPSVVEEIQEKRKELKKKEELALAQGSHESL